jgi:hypothetical protein
MKTSKQVPMSKISSHALRAAPSAVPAGAYCVDAQALRDARVGVPRGEYHR